ncbi:MAG TPA: hypothetical protein P5556_06535 [Candidatus Gastranaerophilales bacterium]|nr:hypothetical protein [Candidatus Gastranaerophilales bacterium]
MGQVDFKNYSEIINAYRKNYGNEVNNGAVQRINGNTKLSFDGNLFIKEKFDECSGKWQIETATDKYSFGGRELEEKISIENEGNFNLDVVNSKINADNADGNITGKNITLNAKNDSDINLFASGQKNLAIVDGSESEVIMRDHNPINPLKGYKTQLEGYAINGAKLTQAAYNPETINIANAETGGQVYQQGGINKGAASGQESLLEQQGSKWVKSLLNIAIGENGANIKQLAEDPNGKNKAKINDASLYQFNSKGNNLASASGDNSIIEQESDSGHNFTTKSIANPATQQNNVDNNKMLLKIILDFLNKLCQ